MKKQITVALALASCVISLSAAMKMTITTTSGTKIVREVANIGSLGFGDNETAIKAFKEQSLKPSLNAGNASLMLTGMASSSYSIKMYDLLGREVYTTTANFSNLGRATISLPTLAQKVYIVKFTTNNQSFTHRISLMK